MTAVMFLLQRVSAVVLAFAVTVHVATILYAVRGGLTAGEVLARTRGNGWFLAFYLVFALAIAIHTPIGLRNMVLALLALLLLGLGMRAALAVYLP